MKSPNLAAAAAATALALGACGSDNPPGKTFYEREIEPILIGSCAGNTGGCHAVDDADAFGFAAGNLDVTSFENVQHRRDVLRPFGAYGVPLLLVKAVGDSGELGVTYDGEFRPLEVQHAGGGVLAVGSDAYLTLLEWTDAGATENGRPPPAVPAEGEGDCSSFVPDGFDDGPSRDDPTFDQFTSEVMPVLTGCNNGSCHGAAQADFYITCGDDDRQLAFNFSQARAFVADPPGNSQILSVPLALGGSGTFHTGGVHYQSRDDDDYAAVSDWAEAVGGVEFGADDPGRQFFARYVQPILLVRGCSFEACHSPAGTNDFQLRSGSQGFFSSIALERNYERLRNQFMALEVPDARRGRAVAKTILDSFGGINHRGGPVLETPGSGGAQPSSCDDPIDPATAPAFCVIQAWLDVEREALIADGDVLPLGEGDTVPVVYVARQPGHVASPLEFDTYQPGSDLRVSLATIGADGALVTPIPDGTSILAGCAGAEDLGAVDVRGPDVRRDGQRVAFAMRSAATAPLQVFTVNLDGTDCVQVTDDEGEVDGILIHDFDPAWSPDGEWIVYASTRGSAGDAPAPSRSRRLFLPQSDLWRVHADGTGAERMTFLTNSEVTPQFMREGRVIMTTEKVSDGFYQLSGRRMNWDLTDYHPLLAQRADSPFADPDDPSVTRPSVGYQQATELRESFDGDFLLILSDAGARGGAGTLALFNRSVGAFEADRDDPGFLRSVVIPDRRATGRAGSDTRGAFRSPFPLLDGRILASYAAYEGDLAQADSLGFQLVAVNPRNGDRETVLASDTESLVEAVLALAYPARQLFFNRRQLVFGGGVDADASGGAEFGVIHFPDAPLIFTLLTANLRLGRPVDLYRGATQIAVYEEKPAPPGTTSGNQGDIYQDRELIGRAPLAEDGSAKVRVPAGLGVILELEDSSGTPLVTMREEHQLGPGENVSFGIAEPLFDAVCGGCHGTVSGQELDVFVTPDALTSASRSLSIDASPASLSR
ncbi:MAG TPA: hypothetical protein VK698_15115 [Kofleriaceae bacterium]|nr:hypothetical protein [Kofleriaceae bacterium]